MPVIRVGVQATSTSSGQVVDFDGSSVASALSITNVSGVSVAYTTDGTNWTTVAAGATATPSGAIAQSTFRLRLVAAGAYPAPVDVTVTANSALSDVQIANFNNGNILDSAGGVYGLSEVMPEVLATATATSTQVTGAGVYGWYRCTTATGNITVYDNTAASGKVLVPTTALAVGVFPIGGAGNSSRLAVSTGVTTVLSGAGVVYIGCETG